MTKDWATCSLSDICGIQSTLVDPREDRHLDSPHVGAGNIESGTGNLQGIRSAREEELISGKFLFDDSMVLYSKIRPYLMKVARPNFSGLCSADIYPLVPKPGRVERDFLFYLLLTDAFTEYAIRGSARAGMPKVNRDHLFAYRVRTPAIEEQRRIVAILDEAFEGIATAKANAEENLHNVRELFEQLHQAAFAAVLDALPARRLGTFARFRNGINYTKQSTGQKAQILGVKDFQNHFWAPLDNLDSVTLDGDLGAADRVAEGDILTVRSNGNPELIGRCMVVGEHEVPITHSGFTIRITLDRSVALSTYVCQFMRSRAVRRELIDGGNGLNIKSLNQGMLSEVMVPLPSLDRQREIVAVIESMAAETARLTDITKRKLVALEELKKSLLHQAFTGQLTASNPTIAKDPLALKTTSPEFTANVICLAYERHKRQSREKTFGHVKAQKVLHLVESIAKVDLGRQPMRDAAGPNDFRHMLNAEDWARANGVFEMVNRGGGYEFRKLGTFDQHQPRARQTLEPYLSQLERVIDLLVPMDTEQAEVFATVHAAWNNLLADGAAVTDDAIVSAAREDWHPDKLKIAEHKFRTAIALIRQKGLVPDGTAKYVGGQQRLI